MAYWVLTRGEQLVGVTNADPYPLALPGIAIHEMTGEIPDLNYYQWDSATDTWIDSGAHLTRLQFLNRFTVQERLTIAASADPMVADIMRLLNVASYIDRSDQNTMMGVGYLAMVGLIANARVAEILA